AAAAALHDRHVAARSQRELRAFTEASLASKSGLSIRPKFVVATGDPAEEILRFARRSKAAVLVAGTHGLSGAERLLLGSTAPSLLQRTSIPILAIPAATGTGTAVPASWPGERIIAALELNGNMRHDVDIATVLADWFETSLVLLHVVSAVAAPA